MPYPDIIDYKILAYVNSFSRSSWTLDQIIQFLSNSNLLSGGILATIIWWIWFGKDENQTRKREHIILIFWSCFVTITIARSLALILPFRLRPLHNSDISLDWIASVPIESWSSFPSDHAALFFTLSWGIFFVSRKVGVFAVIYAICFILFPRIYLGLHYPSDILTGAIIGVAVVWISLLKSINIKIAKPILSFADSKPHIFYPLFFLVTYQISDTFESSRDVIDFSFHLLKKLAAF